MSLGLLEIEQLAEGSEVGGGSEKLCDVAKRNSGKSSYLRHLVSPLLHSRQLLLLVQVGHEVALEENVIVAGTVDDEEEKNIVFE